MSDIQESELLKKRFTELSDRAKSRWKTVYSDFLNLEQQNILNSIYYSTGVRLFGGYEGAERKIACFGNDDEETVISGPPIACIEISPLARKFADKLSHRDFLGALMSLGIKRETLGDIIVYDNNGYVFCLDKISRYIIDNLNSIKHTSVKCAQVSSPPSECVSLPDEESIIAASLRIDALIAAVFKLSRSKVTPLFVQGKVFVSGKQIANSSHNLNEGDIVSVRGFGRFIFCGTSGKTKKDRLKINVRIFK